MTKRFALPLALLAGLAVAGCKKDDDKTEVIPANTELVATLNGAQQVPALPSDSTTATGSFSATYNESTRVLNYTVTFTGLQPTMGHIHRGAPGKNGSVKIPFPITSTTMSPVTSSYTIPASDTANIASLLKTNRAYVNLHTTRFPGGEIRGNITVK